MGRAAKLYSFFNANGGHHRSIYALVLTPTGPHFTATLPHILQLMVRIFYDHQGQPRFSLVNATTNGRVTLHLDTILHTVHAAINKVSEILHLSFQNFKLFFSL